MISITYVSSAVFPFNEATLLDLVGQCQTNNQSLGITGILVYSDGNFMQVIDVREFQGWSMAYNIVPPKALRSHRVPHAFLDCARQRPLPLPVGSASSLVCAFMQG